MDLLLSEKRTNIILILQLIKLDFKLECGSDQILVSVAKENLNAEFKIGQKISTVNGKKNLKF